MTLHRVQALLIPWTNPTIASYNASVIIFYNATGSLARFKIKNIIFYFEKRSSLLQCWRCTCKFKSRRIGYWESPCLGAKFRYLPDKRYKLSFLSWIRKCLLIRDLHSYLPRPPRQQNLKSVANFCSVGWAPATPSTPASTPSPGETLSSVEAVASTLAQKSDY
jgi:hypothetical protein